MNDWLQLLTFVLLNAALAILFILFILFGGSRENLMKH